MQTTHNVEREDPTTQEPFGDLEELRAAHHKLLKASRTEGQDVAVKILMFLARGRATGVKLDTRPERNEAQSLLDYWAAKLYNFRHDVPEATLADSLAPELDDSLCPYVGFRPFQESDRDKFFGREALIEAMLEKIRQYSGLLVVGSSGSGESSAVLAGLVPALKDGKLPGSAIWRYFGPLLPGAEPLQSLALLVKPPDANVPSWVAEQTRQFLANPGHLLSLVNGGAPTPALLLVDQAEEVFTLCTEERTRLAFIENLLSLIKGPGAEHKLVVVLRGDFLSKAQQVPAIKELANLAQMVVEPAPLTPNELRRVIEEPARRVGLKFDDGVVDNLVKEVANDPAALPLLQFTLRKLWDKRSRNRITWDAYQRLGGPRLALARTADELYAQMPPQEQRITREVFLQLVRPSEGIDFTRNRMRRDSLYQLATPEQVNRVVDQLTTAGLLRVTPGETREDDRIEVTHEAVIRNWPRLAGWLREERDRLKQRLRLTAAARFWEDHGEDPGGLLGGSLLQEALRYDDLDPLEEKFVRASEDSAKKAERRRWWFLVAAVVGLAVLVCLLLIAVILYQRLAKENKQQLARVVANRLVLSPPASANREQKLLLCLKAVAALRSAGLEPTPQVTEGIQRLLELPASAVIPGHDLPGHDLVITAVTFSQDGKHLATASADKTVKIWQVPAAKLQQTLTGHTDEVLGVAFSGDGTRVATTSADKTAIIWETTSGKKLQTLLGHKARVFGVTFSPDGRVVATASGDGTARVWDASSGKDLLTLSGSRPREEQPESVFAVAFNSTGNRLITAGSGSVARIWEVPSGRLVLPLAVPPDAFSDQRDDFSDPAISAVALSPDNRRVATEIWTGAVHVWDLESGELLHSIPRGGRALLNGLAFTPDGAELAVANASEVPAGVNIWNVNEEKRVFVNQLGQQDSWPSAFAFSPDASMFAVAFQRTESPSGGADAAGKNRVVVYPVRRATTPIEDAQEEVRRAKNTRLSFAQYLELLQGLESGHADKLQDAAQQLSGSAIGEADKAVPAVQNALSLPGLRDDAAEEARRLVAELMVKKGQELAASGKLEQAVASFEKAQDLDGNLDLDPHKKAGRIVAMRLTERARDLARRAAEFDATGIRLNQESLAKAAEMARQAQALDPEFKFDPKGRRDPEAEAKHLAAKTLVETGRYLAHQAGVFESGQIRVNEGSVAQATELFGKARELDPELKFGPKGERDPEAEAKYLVAEGLIRTGQLLVRQGEVDAAIKIHNEAPKYYLDFQIGAPEWNNLCWWGSLFGKAKDVLFAADKAVTLDEKDGTYRDTRGLARALTGDTKGAIEDFRAFIQWTKDTKQTNRFQNPIRTRQTWIDALEGRSPFTPDVLMNLRSEGELLQWRE
jgi:WD40 repeat protein/tetratricopeptide (TPR) repeat protein